MADYRELSNEDKEFSEQLEDYLYRAARDGEWDDLDHVLANRRYYNGPGRSRTAPHAINWHDRLYARLAINAIRFSEHPELSRRIDALNEFNRRGFRLDYAYYQSEITENLMRLTNHAELSDNIIFMLYLYIRAGDYDNIPRLSEPVKLLLQDPTVRRRFANNLVELYKLPDVGMNILHAVSLLVSNIGPDATGCLIPELLTALLHTVQSANAGNRDAVFRPILTFFAAIYGPEQIRRALMYRVRVNASRRRKHALSLREHIIAGRNPTAIVVSPNNTNDEDAVEAAVEAAEAAGGAAAGGAAAPAAGGISASSLIDIFRDIVTRLTGSCRRPGAGAGGAGAGGMGGGRRTKRTKRRSNKRR